MFQIWSGIMFLNLNLNHIRYEKSFVSAPLQINIRCKSAAQLDDKNVPDQKHMGESVNKVDNYNIGL